MPNVLQIETTDFCLTVWTKDVEKPRAQLQHTLDARNKALPQTHIKLHPAVYDSTVDPPALSVTPTELVFAQAMFFENKLYEFEFKFQEHVKKPAILHVLSSIEDCFHLSYPSLRGSIQFGNDIGWFRLGVSYQLAQREVRQYLSFEVLPTKMDMAEDVVGMRQLIDANYPLWQFSFAKKTEQDLTSSRRVHERFELLWLAHFKALREQLQAAVVHICRAPHTRLMPYPRAVRAEQLRGRLSAKLEERVATDLLDKQTQRRYATQQARLSVDTPENRFVKQVLKSCVQNLARFAERVRQLQQSPERNKISASFFTELASWQKPLEHLLLRPFFAEVGEFSGIAAESLVLHQRAGYAGVYRIWQTLKLYLDVLGQSGAVSMKSIAELYEVWCLLEIRRQLRELGFEEHSQRKASLRQAGMEKGLLDGIGAAFLLERDGVQIRLAHEPIFYKNNNPVFEQIYSLTTKQKPDIFLQATFANGEKVQWIFDAKYRIDTDNNERDLAPEDAINQMHRYRDALIHIHQQQTSRPILGAFVLYPGWFDEKAKSNPYQAAIDAVGIGAFPLLPGKNNLWLHEFLVSRFGNAQQNYQIHEADKYFAEDAARIAPLGTYLSRYPDLTLAAALASKSSRSKVYLQQFEQGQARWYHMPMSTTDNKAIERNIMHEIRYCAVGVHHYHGGTRVIEYVYEVESVRLVRRCEINEEQSGKKDPHNQSMYWLFKLGVASRLNPELKMPTQSKFERQFVLTKASELRQARQWSDLRPRYKGCQID